MKTLFGFLQKSTPEVPSASVIRCAAGTVLQPVQGRVIPRETIPDQTLASGVLGDGVGIEPADDLVVAPFDGTISAVADSRHAIGIEANGMEVLIHIGVDTVNMKGDGFTCLVKEGEAVKAGQYTITDPAGIHARPAGLLVREVRNYASSVTVINGDKAVNALKLLALMGMGIRQSDTVKVTVEGADEDTAAAAIEAFFKANF